ncbi:hypothetical protein GF412_02765 [Candidatus Micrarchaeota archaeon]|nr:hypothetical protein [Candidatus Micrarchaeota archaeon]MBD3417880.1 hypothetical protein [Candidatus Micrarchaeota archaeon]
MRWLICLVLLMGTLFSLQMLEPALTQIEDGETFDIGTMGPGQTVEIQLHPKVYEGGIHEIGGNYDRAYAGELPDGWSSQPSKLYGDPLQVKITADPYTEEGVYTVPIIVEDEGDGEQLGTFTFYLRIKVSEEVMDFSVYPPEKTAGIGQPARFQITVNNRGNAGDTFKVSAEGVSKWEFTKMVYISPKSSKTITYEVAGFEEETYSTLITVESSASSRVSESRAITLYVYPDLLSDYKAVNNGAMLFPVIEAPIYAFVGLLSNLW